LQSSIVRNEVKYYVLTAQAIGIYM